MGSWRSISAWKESRIPSCHTSHVSRERKNVNTICFESTKGAHVNNNQTQEHKGGTIKIAYMQGIGTQEHFRHT